MKHQDLIAIDIHTHAEVSCWNPFDNYGEEYDRAADKYFGSNRRPTIAETVAYYREKKIGLVMFTVDSEAQLGRRRIPNEEIAQAARENSDMMMAFASIDPHKGKMGAREAERLITEEGVKGFKFHPTVQGFLPYDRMAWPIYEVINAHKLPAIFHTGHSGIGSGMRRTRRCPWPRTSPMSGSTCRAGAPSTSPSSWCSTPTPCSRTGCSLAATTP
jgi:predicted TIM-barrel fold metal-dependent hydrolase